MFILPNVIYSFKVIPTKSPMAFFHRKKFFFKLNPKIHIDPQKNPKNPKQSWEKAKLKASHFPIQNILWSYKNQNSITLVVKETQRVVEQD